MQREIRRCHDHLVSIGTGVSLFGIWTVVRIIMKIILEREMIMSETMGSNPEVSQGLATAIIVLLVATVSVIILGIHLYIGLSARKEGLDGKQRTGYLIATGFFIIIYCIGIAVELLSFRTLFQSTTDGVVTIFIDITVIVTLVELMFNAVRVRKLSGQLPEKEEKYAG